MSSTYYEISNSLLTNVIPSIDGLYLEALARIYAAIRQK